MDQTFAQALEAWRDYYTALGGMAAALLGLLFVSVSLRLNLFREQQVADVRAFALLAYGTFLTLALIALFCLAPNVGTDELGGALVALGAVAIGWIAYTLWLSQRVGTQSLERPASWRWAYFGAALAAYGGLAAVGLPLLDGRTGARDWLLPVTLALLVLGAVNTWVLLSHAQPAG